MRLPFEKPVESRGLFLLADCYHLVTKDKTADNTQTTLFFILH